MHKESSVSSATALRVSGKRSRLVAIRNCQVHDQSYLQDTVNFCPSFRTEVVYETFGKIMRVECSLLPLSLLLDSLSVHLMMILKVCAPAYGRKTSDLGQESEVAGSRAEAEHY